MQKGNNAVDSNPASAARVQASPLIVRVGRSRVRGTICTSRVSSRLLLVLSLVLLNFLGLALALLVELLVLGLDLRIAVFRLAAATAGTRYQLVCDSGF
jgi:hypothetical protein